MYNFLNHYLKENIRLFEEKISVVEVPKGANKGEYCLNFLKKNSIHLENLVAKTMMRFIRLT